MKINLTKAGLFNARQFDAWSTARRSAIKAAVKRGMETGGVEVRNAVRAQMRSAFQVKRNSFVASMGAKVLDRKPERLPALLIGSKIPWLGIHEKGGKVSGNLLIPLLPGRIGPKRFRRVIDQLMRSGNAFFIEKDGKVILMAENIRDDATALKRFKRAERTRKGGQRLEQGHEIPIAVLVKSVSLKRRLDLVGSVKRSLPQLVKAIERELGHVK